MFEESGVAILYPDVGIVYCKVAGTEYGDGESDGEGADDECCAM